MVARSTQLSCLVLIGVTSCGPQSLPPSPAAIATAPAFTMTPTTAACYKYLHALPRGDGDPQPSGHPLGCP